MKNAYAFTAGLAAGALDCCGWLNARDFLMRVPKGSRGRAMDGFDLFYDVTNRLRWR